MGEIYAKGEVCFGRTKDESSRRLKREDDIAGEEDEDAEAEEKLMEATGKELDSECFNLSPGLSGIMAESTDFKEKKFVWQVGTWKLELCISLSIFTGPGKRMVPRLREFFRQGQAEVVSSSKNKILATWEPFFCRTLYLRRS